MHISFLVHTKAVLAGSGTSLDSHSILTLLLLMQVSLGTHQHQHQSIHFLKQLLGLCFPMTDMRGNHSILCSPRTWTIPQYQMNRSLSISLHLDQYRLALPKSPEHERVITMKT